MFEVSLQMLSIALVSSIALTGIASQSTTTSSKYEKFSGKKLVSPMAKIIPKTNVMRCSFYCLENPICKSFNFAKNDGEIGFCELLTETTYSVPVENTVDDKHYDHYHPPGPCDRNPCENGGTCFANRTSSNPDAFFCNCLSPMGGDTCTVVLCPGEKCYKKDNLIIYLITTGNTLYNTAKAGCEKTNRTLVMLKDQEKNTFVRDILVHLYENDTNVKHTYYIGLKQDPFGPFKWVDKTPLGDFVGWSNEPGLGDCVCLPNTSPFDFYWDRDACDASYAGWTYYYICEKYVNF